MSSRVIGRAAFLSGKHVQDFPIYGAERRGAPVSDYVRVDDERILERGYIEEPDAVIVLDDTLLELIDVKSGLKETGFCLFNSQKSFEGQRTFSIDATETVLEETGKPIANIALLGAFAKLQEVFSLEMVLEAAKLELREHGVSDEVIEANLKAAVKCFEKTVVENV